MDQDDDIIDEQDESPVEIETDESSSDSSIPSDVEFSEEPLNRGTTSVLSWNQSSSSVTIS